jgi:hypothetical protein
MGCVRFPDCRVSARQSLMQRWTVRSAGNFHPEWGYFAPMPSFRRGFRVALIAAAVGATAGSVVVATLVSPAPRQARPASVSAQALIIRADAVSSSADGRSGTAAAAADTAPPPPAAPSFESAASIENGAVPEIAAPDTAGPVLATPSAGINPTPDAVPTKKSAGRTHRPRFANARKYPRDERGRALSFQLPQNSRLAQFERFCCTWTIPPRQRNMRQR